MSGVHGHGGTRGDRLDSAAAGRPDGAAAVVVGGGLAGITAALALADAGLRVTIAESRPRLGGLAFSFRRGALWVDNGQHVFLRCCTAYRGLLDRIGASGLVTLQDRLDVPVLDVARAGQVGRGAPGPRYGRLRRSALPVPLHLAGSLARYPHLSPGERLAVGRAALALRGLDPKDPALDAQDFAGWLAGRGQSARAVEALWDLVGVATLNAHAKNASLGLAAMVFRTGLLSDPGAADIGWARVPLGRIHDEAARSALARGGVRVLLRGRVSRVAADQAGGYSVTVESGTRPKERLAAETVVLAVPPTQAHALLPDGALDAPARLLDMRYAPILNIHVVYDRPVLRGRPFFAALGSPVQWVFDRTESSGLAAGQYLALSQSAANDEIDVPTAELRTRYLPELERILPAARAARVQDFFVTRERTATFAPEPGVGRLRPAARTRAPGLYLAGAWTDTGWPATMEGAVRSGLQAAAAALSGPARAAGRDGERSVPAPSGPRKAGRHERCT